MSKKLEAAFELELFKVFINTMPRKSYRKSYYRKKKHWASHIDEITGDVTASPAQDGMITHVICENSSDNTNPSPFLIKCGNISLDLGVQFSIDDPVSLSAHFTFTVGVIFLPQGVSYASSANTMRANILNHPEWVIWLKQYSPQFYQASATNTYFQNPPSIKMSSRLKRNLNSGDKIVFFMLNTTTQVASNFEMQVYGYARYFTRIAS